MDKDQNYQGHDDKETLSEDFLSQFLQNQTQELKNVAQEIELQKINQQNAYQYGLAALDVQQQDRKERRGQITLFMKYGFWLTIVILTLLSLFVTACIYTDNINIIVSFFKIVAYIIPSLIGGYFIGLNRGKKLADNSPSVEIIED